MALWLNEENLLSTMLAREGRPMAYLVGSAMSRHGEHGAAVVGEYIAIAREAVRRFTPGREGAFDKEMERHQGNPGAGYREAMSYLAANASKDVVDGVVKEATARAYKHLKHRGIDGAVSDTEPKHWDLPPGPSKLAELIVTGGSRFFGPILTTNFDPLLERSVQGAGGAVNITNLATPGDGIQAQEQVGKDTVRVVHLHGFWSSPGTLHTESELTEARPRVERALQKLLVEERRALLVVGYSGWEDVFTRSLFRFIEEGDINELDIRWCFYERSEKEVRANYPRLVASVERAMNRHRFRPFLGINCHEFFAKLLNHKGLGPSVPGHGIGTAGVGRGGAPVVVRVSAGAEWDRIDADHLRRLPSLTGAEAVQYFDGAMPTWRHAVSARIPRREAVGEIVRRLQAMERDPGGRSMQLVHGMAAEGTSTVLLQAAAEAVLRGGWSVYWRPHPDAPLDPDAVMNLEPDRRWLVVADDADGIAGDLHRCAYRLHTKGRSNIHFLLGASSSLWASCTGKGVAWETMCNPYTETRLQGATLEECRGIIAKWSECGQDGLRTLGARGGDPEDWAKALLRMIGDHDAGDSSFFGGLLTIRFDQKALRAHARQLLARLDKIKAGQKELHTHADAIVYVSVAQCGGFDGLDRRILAELLGVNPEGGIRGVLNQLAEAAAGNRQGRMVVARHRMIAEEVVLAAEEMGEEYLDEVCEDIVKQTLRLASRGELEGRWISLMEGFGKSLFHGLPQRLSQERRADIAIAAAKALVEAKPKNLRHVVTVGCVYREVERLDDGTTWFAERLGSAPGSWDYRDAIRGYCYEWGVNAGLRRGAGGAAVEENIWLAGVSLCDQLETDDLTQPRGSSDRIGLSLHGLGEALARRVRDGAGAVVFARGLIAVGMLGGSRGGNDRLEDFAKYKSAGARAGATAPRDAAEAVRWLREAVVKAGNQATDPAMRKLVGPEEISFDMLLDAMRVPEERVAGDGA